MATYDSSTMTSQPAKAVHAGLNAVVADYTFESTSATGDMINICKLPRGAQVIDCKLVQTSGNVHGGYSVFDNEGNNYVATATPTANIQSVGTGNGFGTRITGSAHLYVRVTGITAAIASASADLRVTVQYLAEQEGD